MRKLILALFAVTILSCNDKPSERVVSQSSGGLNTLTVVMNNDLWQGSIGENIREKLAGPVNGLPQIEPMFDINQMPDDAFSGFMRKQRTFLKVEQSDSTKMEVVEDLYAKPQTGIVISGPNSDAINNIIQKDSATIVNTLKDVEIKEKIRRISLSLKDDEQIQKQFGISLKFPSAYRYAKTVRFRW